MKNSAYLLLILTICSLATGCMSSLSPFYSPNDVYADRNLVGTWKEPGERESWKFETLTQGKYRVTLMEADGTQSTFEATLFKIADDSFLDLRPVRRDDRSGDLHRSLTAAMHLLVAVKIEERSAQVAALDESKLKDMLSNGRASLAHTFVNGELVITDKTENLRAFLATNGDRAGVFDSWTSLERVEAKK